MVRQLAAHTGVLGTPVPPQWLAAFAAIVVCLCTIASGADPKFKVADVVFVSADGPLKNSGRVVGQVKAGEILRVKEIRGVWLLVESAKGDRSGWLRINQLRSREESTQAIAERLSANANDYDALLIRGRWHFARKEYGEARADFERVRDASEHKLDALLWIGKVALAENELDEAEQTLSLALKDSPEHVECRRARAEVRGQAGKFLERRTDLEKLVDSKNATAEETRQLAWEYAVHPDSALRDGKKGVELAKRAIALSGFETPELLETLAAAYAENKEFSEAITTQRRVATTEGREAKKFEDEQRLANYEKSAAYRESPEDTWKKRK